MSFHRQTIRYLLIALSFLPGILHAQEAFSDHLLFEFDEHHQFVFSQGSTTTHHLTYLETNGHSQLNDSFEVLSRSATTRKVYRLKSDLTENGSGRYEAIDSSVVSRKEVRRLVEEGGLSTREEFKSVLKWIKSNFRMVVLPVEKEEWKVDRFGFLVWKDLADLSKLGSEERGYLSDLLQSSNSSLFDETTTSYLIEKGVLLSRDAVFASTFGTKARGPNNVVDQLFIEAAAQVWTYVLSTYHSFTFEEDRF